jgi:hypothetical protein
MAESAEKNTCSQCFIPFMPNDQLIRIPCFAEKKDSTLSDSDRARFSRATFEVENMHPNAHVTHKDCLLKWLAQNEHCPVCQGDLTAEMDF